ncbi:MAG TPA: transcriptional regulator, partial [Candidatus Tectomicrobia bacterium]|nr:transcriptional regulator [Candidatus Tectomicrobia bacterium]
MTREEDLLFGAFRLDPGNACVWHGQEALRLTPKAFAVLYYLAAHPDRLITRAELFEAAWSGVAVSEAALTVCIGELRRALGDEAHPHQFIETVHRRGYRFIGPVQGPESG